MTPEPRMSSTVRDLLGALVIAALGAVGCVVGLTVVVDPDRDDASTRQAVFVVGLVLAVVTVGLVAVGAQRTAAQVRRLQALTSDLEDDIRAVARGKTVIDRDEVENQGRRLRYQALELGATKLAQRITEVLWSLDEPFEGRRG